MQNKPTFFVLAVVFLLIHVILCAVPAAIDNTDFTLERNHSSRCSPVETVFLQLVLGIKKKLSLFLYFSCEKKQKTREENHLMEDKKKKKQEEKKKKDAAQKKVSLWQALLFATDTQPPSSSKEEKCYPTQSILPLPFSSTKPRCQCCNAIGTILNIN